VAGYLVELYVSRFRSGELTLAAERVREAAEGLTRTGTAVHFLRTIFVPEDETCFHVLDGPSSEAVAETARRAGISTPRITRAVP
jgi:hypothetical protein